MPLRLLFALDDPSLAATTTYSWASSDISLAGTATGGGTTSPTLVIQPYLSTGAAVLPDGAQLTFNLTATSGGLSASATIAVGISRRPACTAVSCLAASPTSGAQDTTAFALTASNFAADEPLVFDWGQITPGGYKDFWARSSQQASFTFAAGTLDAGNQTLFMCARGEEGELCLGWVCPGLPRPELLAARAAGMNAAAAARV